jgi:hypothetical protein
MMVGMGVANMRGWNERNTMKDENIVFECLGFFSTPVFYRLDCGYLYQMGTFYSHKGFDPYEGFLPRDKVLPILPSIDEVNQEYDKRFNGEVKINEEIVHAG